MSKWYYSMHATPHPGGLPHACGDGKFLIRDLGLQTIRLLLLSKPGEICRDVLNSEFRIVIASWLLDVWDIPG
jgi:hypothetical protein